MVINVAKTSLCIGLLISDIFVCFHVVSLQLPLHSLCAWFVYQIIVLLQKKLYVQQGVFLLFLALVFLFRTYFFLQNIFSFYYCNFWNRLGNKVFCNFSLPIFTPMHKTKLCFSTNFMKISFFCFVNIFLHRCANITPKGMDQTSRI